MLLNEERRRLKIRKREEKLLCIFLILLILFSISTVYVAPVSANETTKLYVDPPSIINPTFYFTIDVTLANVANLWCWEYKLKWDPAIIKFVRRVTHAPAGWQNPWVSDVVGADYHWYACSAIHPDPPFTGNISLCTYTFQLFDVGNCALDLYDIILLDYNITAIPHSVENGYFENQPNPFPWDVTRDGKVNIKDIGIIGKAFGSRPGDPNWLPIADVYEDGKINIKDIGVVAKHFGESV